MKILENKLVQAGIPIFIPLDDVCNISGDIQSQIMTGKVTFCSFHQSKGLEKKHVYVFGFSNSYFNFYAKDADSSVCPNVFYVAVTRALERLSVVAEECDGEHLPFIDLLRLSELAEGGPDSDVDIRYTDMYGKERFFNGE